MVRSFGVHFETGGEVRLMPGFRAVRGSKWLLRHPHPFLQIMELWIILRIIIYLERIN